MEEIEGVKITEQVKYLGMKLTMDVDQIKRDAMVSTEKNLGWIRNKVKFVDSDIKEHMICAYARSLIIYHGTPLVAAKVWKQQDIESLERRSYRKAYGLSHDIGGVTMMNVASSQEPVWKVIERLANKA